MEGGITAANIAVLLLCVVIGLETKEMPAMGQETLTRKAPWVGSQAGISDEVLALWTSIQVETAGKAILTCPHGRYQCLS